jgi:hypothetical protein
MMRFWVLVNSTYDATVERKLTDFFICAESKVGDAPRCPVCGNFVGLLTWLPPYKAQLEIWRDQYGDIAFGPGDELLITGKFKKLFLTSGLTGMEGFSPVEITKVILRDGSKVTFPPPEYFYATVNRSRAAVDFKASGLELAEPYTCDKCREETKIRMKRLVIEEGSWSGEDLFRPRGLYGIVVASERFRKWFEENDINNGTLIAASEFAFDYG